MEYKAEDYINFIEVGRLDKISPNSLNLIAKRFRELEKSIEYKTNIFNEIVSIIENNSMNNTCNIPDVKLWASSWRQEFLLF